MNAKDQEDWKRDCLHWRGIVLAGKYSHWCYDWDFLPIDETTPEWPCSCREELQKELDAAQETNSQADLPE